jgi:hypothetical protein
MTTALSEQETVKCGKSNKRMSKVERYGWILRDMPGVFMEISKADLNIDHSYQRDDINEPKILEIAKNWSWVGCGAILVAVRPDGTWFVFDGQHRVLAARKRSDVLTLPCMVYECESVQQEAVGFLVSNDHRKPVTAIGKFKSLVMAEDEIAVRVREVLEQHGLELCKTATKPGQIKCVRRCQFMCSTNATSFERCLALAAEACEGECAIQEDLLMALFGCHQKHKLLDDRRFCNRVKDIGVPAIMEQIRKTRGYRGIGGEETAREGLLFAVNKGLRQKFGESSDK